MGYNSEDPPEYVRDLVEEYNLEVRECGYMRGSWVEVESDELGRVKLELSPPTRIKISKGYRGSLDVSIPVKDGIGLVEKNDKIREQLNDLLLGYNSLKDALESEA